MPTGFALFGCAGPSATPGGSSQVRARPEQEGPLVLTIRAEPDTLAEKEPISVTGLSLSTTPRLFNAGLSMLDGQEIPRPYLAEQLPQLNTDTWRLLPDGKMEMLYGLRPNLTWHDGAPLNVQEWQWK